MIGTRHSCRDNDLPISGVGAAKSAPRFYTMSLRRPHQLQRLCGGAPREGRRDTSLWQHLALILETLHSQVQPPRQRTLGGRP